MVVKHQKIAANHKNQTLQVNEFHAFLCWGWYSRVWARWHHSLDTHISYLGSVSYFSPFWIPLRIQSTGAAAVADGLIAGIIACLLRWQATLEAGICAICRPGGPVPATATHPAGEEGWGPKNCLHSTLGRSLRKEEEMEESVVSGHFANHVGPSPQTR